MGKFDKDSLGGRMKDYESITKTRLLPRMPFIIRLDGKAFHTFTKGLQKPFDNILIKSMQETMFYLCNNLSGCKFGYTQSDEITLVFTIKDPIKTQGLFDYEIQKLVSISASMATLAFNRTFRKLAIKSENEILFNKIDSAMFDSRVFNLPDYEIINNLIWRQQDAVRNSINSLAQMFFSQKELMNKNTSDVIDLLVLQKNVNWNDLEIKFKRGTCCEKNAINNKWEINEKMPILTTPDGRKFIENILLN